MALRRARRLLPAGHGLQQQRHQDRNRSERGDHRAARRQRRHGRLRRLDQDEHRPAEGGHRPAQRRRLELPGHLRAEGHGAFARRSRPPAAAPRSRTRSRARRTGRRARRRQAVDFAGSDSAIKPEEKAAFGGRKILYFPIVGGPDHARLQPDGRRQPAAQRRHARQDLPGADHHLERPGDQGRQPGRHPAVDQDHRRPPLRRLRHHQQLHQVPRAAAPTVWTLDPGETVKWPASTQGAEKSTGVTRSSSRPTAPSATSTWPTPPRRTSTSPP